MSDPKEQRLLVFSDAQNRIITASLTLLCCVVLGVTAVALLWLVLQGLSYFLHIVGPVIVAFFLSLLTRPWYARLVQFFQGQVLPAVIIFMLSFFLPLLLMGWFFGAFLVEQWTNLSNALPGMIEKLNDFLQSRYPDIHISLRDILPSVGRYLGAEKGAAMTQLADWAGKSVWVGGAVLSAGSTFLLWLLTFFYWIIFVMQRPLTGEDFAKRLPFLGCHGRRAVARYFRNFNDIIVSYFRGQIIDVLIQGFLYGSVFQILNLPNGFIIGFVLGLLNLVPYLGVMVGLCVALPMAFFHAGLSYMLMIFGVFCGIQTFDGYIMQPYIQGDRMKLSAWQIVFALLFWTQLGGFLGLLLAIPLTAFLKASWGEWRDSSERFIGGQRNTAQQEEA